MNRSSPLITLSCCLATLAPAQSPVAYRIDEVVPAPDIGDGGPATAALLSGPQRIAFDSVGRLFIADSRHNLIRQVDSDRTIS